MNDIELYYGVGAALLLAGLAVYAAVSWAVKRPGAFLELVTLILFISTVPLLIGKGAVFIYEYVTGD